MEKLQINNKDLIKRARELVALIENNELANSLTQRLRTTEQEIELKAQYAKELKEWQDYGFRKNEIMLKSMIDQHNSRSSHTIVLQILDQPDYAYITKMSIILRFKGGGIICRKDHRVSTEFEAIVGTDTRRRRLEDSYGEIIQHIFDTGIQVYIPVEPMPVTDKASDPYWSATRGVQVMRPTNAYSLEYGVDDYRHPIHDDTRRIKEEIYPPQYR